MIPPYVSCRVPQVLSCTWFGLGLPVIENVGTARVAADLSPFAALA
jgi:hypothetical protein